MKKRGLSTIVVTLIIILVSLVAVGLVWVAVKNIIQTGTEQSDLSQFSLNAKISNVFVDNNSNNVSLTVKRNVGQGDLSKISFVFSDGINNEVVTQDISLKEMEQKNFNFHLENISVNNLISVSIAPRVNKNGKELPTTILDNYNLKDNIKNQTFPSGCTPATCSVLGYTCGTWNNGTCSGTLNCGTCSSGYNCVGGSCVANYSCTPATCEGLGYICGNYANGCNGTLNCGDCSYRFNCNVSGRCIATECVDRDGGLNYSVYGEVFTQGNSMPSLLDTCNGNILYEGYCTSGGGATASSYTCPYGCVEGYCVNSSFNYTQYYQSICIDSDSGVNYYVKGSTRGIKEDGVTWQNSSDSCSGNSLTEWFCSPEYKGIKNRLAYNIWVCPNNCVNGACIPESGMNCTSGYKCQSANYMGFQSTNCQWNNVHYCSYGCIGGFCNPGPINQTDVYRNCTDSDGGLNYFMFGSVYKLGNSTPLIVDSCSGNIMTEGYCAFDIGPASIIFTCQAGCSSNNACNL